MLRTDERVLQAEGKCSKPQDGRSRLEGACSKTLVEKEHGDFQSLKGQLARGKSEGRVWGNEVGEAGARSRQVSVGHCKDLDFVLPVQRYPWRVFIWGRGQQQLPGEQIYYYRHLAEEVGDAWTCMVDETMERSDWIPEWFRSCLCSNPTF